MEEENNFEFLGDFHLKSSTAKSKNVKNHNAGHSKEGQLSLRWASMPKKNCTRMFMVLYCRMVVLDPFVLALEEQ